MLHQCLNGLRTCFLCSFVLTAIALHLFSPQGCNNNEIFAEEILIIWEEPKPLWRGWGDSTLGGNGYARDGDTH